MRKPMRMYIFLLLIFLLSSCMPSDFCMDSGGVWDYQEKKCFCPIYQDNGYCKSRPLPEIFTSTNDQNPDIFIQRTGSARRVEVGGIKIENAVLKNRYSNEGDVAADFIFAPELGFAISIPHHPDKIQDRWKYENCLFEKTDQPLTDITAKGGVFGFIGSCEGSKTKTLYWVTRELDIVAFSLMTRYEEGQFLSSMIYTNNLFQKQIR